MLAHSHPNNGDASSEDVMVKLNYANQLIQRRLPDIYKPSEKELQMPLKYYPPSSYYKQNKYYKY